MEMPTGKTIQTLRRQKGLTQEQLAEAVGVTAAAPAAHNVQLIYIFKAYCRKSVKIAENAAGREHSYKIGKLLSISAATVNGHIPV